MFIIKFCLNTFRGSLCPYSGEKRPCYCIWCILVWFCWMWLVAVVGRCLVGCVHYEGFCSTNKMQLLLHLVSFFCLHTLPNILFRKPEKNGHLEHTGHHLWPVQRVKMRSAIPPLPNTSPWRGDVETQKLCICAHARIEWSHLSITRWNIQDNESDYAALLTYRWNLQLRNVSVPTEVKKSPRHIHVLLTVHPSIIYL